MRVQPHYQHRDDEREDATIACQALQSVSPARDHTGSSSHLHGEIRNGALQSKQLKINCQKGGRKSPWLQWSLALGTELLLADGFLPFEFGMNSLIAHRISWTLPLQYQLSLVALPIHVVKPFSEVGN